MEGTIKMNEALKKTLYAGLQYGTMEYWTDETIVFRDGTFIPIGQFTMSIRNASDLKCIGMLSSVKPILFSLDQLTKPIEIGGERFVPMERIRSDFGYNEDELTYLGVVNYAHCFKLPGHMPAILHLPYCIIEKLHEWQFNVFNLPPDQYIKAEYGKYY